MDKVILNFGKNNVDYNINKVYETVLGLEL